MKDPLDTVSVKGRQIVLFGSIVVALLALLGIADPNALGVVGILFFFFIVMIGLHELGHFLLAKRAGMKVSEFFIGFGPRLWSVHKGETEYGVKALPLGGYCKIIGMTNLEDVDPADEPRTFRAKGFWAKTSTLLAGPASHFILALILMAAVLSFAGDYHSQKPLTVVDSVQQNVLSTQTVGGKTVTTTTRSPAAAAGLRPGDRIQAVDGKVVSEWTEVQKEIRSHGGREISINVLRGPTNEAVTLRATLLTNGPTGHGVGFLGISPQSSVPHPSVLAAVGLAPVRTAEVLGATVQGFGHIFSPSGISAYLSNFSDKSSQSPKAQQNAQNARFVSPVGVAGYASDAVAAGWATVFGLLIAINVSIGFLNLLPLIPFDGGHIAVAMFEAVMTKVHRRKYRVDFAKLMPVAVATLGILAFIFLSSLFLDIAHPVANPF